MSISNVPPRLPSKDPPCQQVSDGPGRSPGAETPQRAREPRHRVAAKGKIPVEVVVPHAPEELPILRTEWRLAQPLPSSRVLVAAKLDGDGVPEVCKGLLLQGKVWPRGPGRTSP